MSFILTLLSVFYAFLSKEYDAIPKALIYDAFHPSTPDKVVSILLFVLSLLQIVLAFVKLLQNDDYVEDYDEAWVHQFIRFFSNCFRNLLPSSWTIEREPPMDDGNQNFRWERDREYEE